MQLIHGVLLEPVGCLAEFPSEPFHEIAFRLFGRKRKPSTSASRSYWHLLNLMETSPESPPDEDLELQAVDGAKVYEDVVPALTELKAMGVKLLLTSSLSHAAIGRFLETCCPRDLFDSVSTRDNSG